MNVEKLLHKFTLALGILQGMREGKEQEESCSSSSMHHRAPRHTGNICVEFAFFFLFVSSREWRRHHGPPRSHVVVAQMDAGGSKYAAVRGGDRSRAQNGF